MDRCRGLRAKAAGRRSVPDGCAEVLGTGCGPGATFARAGRGCGDTSVPVLQFFESLVISKQKEEEEHVGECASPQPACGPELPVPEGPGFEPTGTAPLGFVWGDSSRVYVDVSPRLSEEQWKKYPWVRI